MVYPPPVIAEFQSIISGKSLGRYGTSPPLPNHAKFPLTLWQGTNGLQGCRKGRTKAEWKTHSGSLRAYTRVS